MLRYYDLVQSSRRNPLILENSRVFRRADWIKHIYYLHVLDHPHRSTRSREALPKVWIENPYLKTPAIPPLPVPRGRPNPPELTDRRQ